MLAREEKLRDAPLELALLAAASFACVIVLTLAVVAGGVERLGGMQLGAVLQLVVATGAGSTVAAIVVATLRLAQRRSRQAIEENGSLRDSLAMSEAVLRAEPQVLLFWEHGARVRLVTHTLLDLPGVPARADAVLRFGEWLRPDSAEELRKNLDRLFGVGKAFTAILETASGSHVEADGRASAGRAILRMRDVAGFKSDLARLLEVNQRLSKGSAADRAVLAGLPFPVWIRSVDGSLQWANAAYVSAVELTDLAEAQTSGIHLLESHQRAAVAARLTAGRPVRERMGLIVAGERRICDVTVVPHDGGSVGFATDATALVTAQGELDRRVQSYDRTLDRVVTGVAIFDSTRRLTFCNKAFERLFQIDPKWLEERPTDSELLDRLRAAGKLPEARAYREWKSRLLAVREGETAYEDWWRLPNGHTLHALVEPRNEGGLTFLLDDVTERLELESNFNGQIDVQRETLNNLEEGVAVFGTDGRLRLFNDAFANYWKLPRRMLEANPHVDDLIARMRASHDVPADWAVMKGAVTGQSDMRTEVRRQLDRADQKVFDLGALPLPDGGTLVTFADITDSKRVERALNERNTALHERNAALEAADRQKSRFIRHVSYELRTPLTNIIGFSDMLVAPWGDPLSERQRDYVAAISTSSHKLLSVIDDILDLAIIDAGGLELHKESVAVDDLFARSIGVVGERMASQGVDIRRTVSADAHTVMADRERLGRVVTNLLTNAVGFSHTGGSVRLAARREADDLVIEVVDDGPGIPLEQQVSIFERFASESRGSKHRGAGLGLAVVKSLVELHRGTVSLESAPGKGTSVRVRLPLEDVTQAPADH